MARPTKYKEEYNYQAFVATSELGADDKALAKLFKTSKATIENWKIIYPNFLDSIKKGKDIWDTDKIEKALSHRARGYSHEDTYFAQFQGTIISETYTKHYPPDVTACIFWLCNRNRLRWKSINANLISEIGENAEQYFKQIADAIKESDTRTN